LLSAETADDAANIFARVAEAIESAGVQDPEELLRIKMNGLVNKFINGAEMQLGAIKSTFNKTALEATEPQQVISAYETAASQATQLMATIDRDM
jgi:hypothetical protein